MMRRVATLALLAATAAWPCHADTIVPPRAETLEQVLSRALDASDEIGIAREKIEQTKATIGEAHAAYMPQVTLTHKAGRNAAYPSSNRSFGDPRGASEYVNTSSSKLEVNQMLFDGFRTPAEIKRQRKVLQGLEQRYRSISQEVLRNTLTAYLTAWRNMQALRAGVALMEDMQEINRKVQLQAKLGAADLASKSYAEARLTGARQELLKNKNAYRDALYRLSYLLRTDLKPESFAMAELQAPTLQQRDRYLGLMQADNPQLLEEKANEEAAKAAVRKARAGVYPTLSLTSDLEDTNDVGGSSGNARIGNVMLQASYKIFDGFASRYERRRAASELTEAQLRQQRTQRQLTEDISQLWRQTKATQEEFNLAMQEVAASRQVLLVRRQDVDNGAGDIVRLIEAQENHYATTLHAIELAQAIASKRFELAIAAGELDDTACLSTSCNGLSMAPIFANASVVSQTAPLPVSATVAVSKSSVIATARPSTPVQQAMATDFSAISPAAGPSAPAPQPSATLATAGRLSLHPMALPGSDPLLETQTGVTLR